MAHSHFIARYRAQRMEQGDLLREHVAIEMGVADANQKAHRFTKAGSS